MLMVVLVLMMIVELVVVDHAVVEIQELWHR